MNEAEILAMASEARLDAVMSIEMDVEFLLKFAGLVAAHEREACANVCEETGAYTDELGMALMCADAIRRRNQQ
jgi:hypothetical protein